MYNLYTYEKQLEENIEKVLKERKDKLLFKKRHSIYIIF